MTGPGCVVRFFERNDRIKKHLFHRIVLEGKTLEEATAVAYHTLVKTSEEKKETLLSVEIEVVTVPALVAAGG
jgi:hypothetical protein